MISEPKTVGLLPWRSMKGAHMMLPTNAESITKLCREGSVTALTQNSADCNLMQDRSRGRNPGGDGP